MPEETIVIYATDWCWDCRRAKKFFDQNNIPYRWINIDRDPQAEKFVLNTNRGMRSVPTILLPSGEILVEPSEKKLHDLFIPKNESPNPSDR